MFSLHIERGTFLGINISFLRELSVWCCCLLFVVMRHCMLAHCNAICSFILVCTLKVRALTMVCILSSCKPLLAAWSAFSLPGIQLIVGICVNLDAACLLALAIVFKSSFLLFNFFLVVLPE